MIVVDNWRVNKSLFGKCVKSGLVYCSDICFLGILFQLNDFFGGGGMCGREQRDGMFLFGDYFVQVKRKLFQSFRYEGIIFDF